MAFVTFNPAGVIQIKINRFSPREMLLFQVKGVQGHHAADNASPVALKSSHLYTYLILKLPIVSGNRSIEDVVHYHEYALKQTPN